MNDIEYYHRDASGSGEKIIRDRFKDSFDANIQICRDLDGKYEKSAYMSGEDHMNKCALPSGMHILGWRDTNRFDLISENNDMIFNAEKIQSHEYANKDAETYFRWGVPGVFSDEEGIHGSVAISKKHGLDSVGINEYKNHTDSPFFTIYSKKVK